VHTLPTQIVALAERQSGAVTRAQLREHGLSNRQIDARLGDVLLPLHPETFRLVGAQRSRSQLLWAAALHVHESFVSHRAAAAELGGLRPSMAPVEVSVGRWSRPAPRGVHIHRSTDLAPRWTTTRTGLPITTPARTIVDLGAVMGAKMVESVLSSFIRDGMLTEQQAVIALFAHSKRGRRGCGVLRAVLDVRDSEDLLESELEVIFRRLCREHVLPQPVAQHAVTVAGRPRRIDFAFVQERIAIEVDGFAFHSSRDAFVDDRRRQNALELDGWLVLRFT
jgi:hypothetical protein